LGAGAAAAAPDSMVWSAAPGERSEVRGLRQQPARNRTDTGAEFVEQQAQAKGIAVVDWIRFAIAFAYWEEDFVRNLEGWLTPAWKPGDKPLDAGQHDFEYLTEFESVCGEYESPNSQTDLETAGHN
jgi:hypothetical protein